MRMKGSEGKEAIEDGRRKEGNNIVVEIWRKRRMKERCGKDEGRVKDGRERGLEERVLGRMKKEKGDGTWWFHPLRG